MTALTKKKLIGIKVYLWSITFALILHVFNELGVGELKIFHIPAAVAFIIPIIFAYRINKIQSYSYFLIVVTFLSALFSSYPQSLSKALTFMIVIGSCVAIPKCNYNYIVKLSNILIPIPLAFLVVGLMTNVSYRYTGMYNDPNYLCTTLLVFLFLILQGFHIFHNKVIKIGFVCEIVIILALTVATLSRTGLACIMFMIVISAWEFIKKYKVMAVALLIAGGIYLYSDTPQAIIEAIDQIESREDNKDNFASASNLRYEISMGGIRYVLSNPENLPIGMGIGAVGHWEYFNSDNHDSHIDHNTLTASFSEQGIIGFILFLLILITTFKVNWNLPKGNRLRLLRLSALITIFLFCISINQMTYLPFWWIIFLLNNTTSLNENSSHRRLRSLRKY